MSGKNIATDLPSSAPVILVMPRRHRKKRQEFESHWPAGIRLWCTLTSCSALREGESSVAFGLGERAETARRKLLQKKAISQWHVVTTRSRR